MLWTMTVAAALAGYGDPVAGVPDTQSRALSVWVNAVRTDPEAFEAEYNAGGCSYYTDFDATEQTPQMPYRVQQDLNEAARVHNDDMLDNNWFSHDSSDGTAWDVRISSYYPNWTMLGENIAAQSWYSPREMVTLNWMCSPFGHRGAIMGSFADLGAAHGGANFDYKGTLDFATGAGGAFPPLRVGVHEPTTPATDVDLRVDWTDGAAPDRIEAVMDGEAIAMSLEFGSGDNGLYHVNAPVDASACHRYFFEAELGGVVTRWPETGSYGWGACTFADADAMWLDTQVGPLAYTQSTDTWTPGGSVTLTVTGAVPNEAVVFLRGTNGSGGLCPPQLSGTCIDIGGNVALLGQVVADNTGTATLNLSLPASAPTGITVHHQAAASDGVGNWSMAPADTATLQ